MSQLPLGHPGTDAFVFGASWGVFESRLEVKLIIHTAQIEHFSTVIPGQKITNHGGTYAYDHNHGFLWFVFLL